MTDYSRLSMPIGEAMFSRRSVRTFKPDPMPKENLSLIVEAAVKAPNSGNRQVACLFLVTDRAKIREFAPLCRKAWWVKRLDGKGWRCSRARPCEREAHVAHPLTRERA